MAATETTGATFQINNAKTYIPVVSLFINDNLKFLENVRQGLKELFLWNKDRCEITKETKNNNLDYLIDSIFKNVNRLFVLSFKNDDDDPMRGSFDEYITCH